MSSLRTALQNVGKEAAHAGLLHHRYVDIDIKPENMAAYRANWNKKLRAAVVRQEVFLPAFERWRNTLKQLPGSKMLKCVPATPAVLGLGRSSVQETGLTLHHVYGVPFIPGSSLKGLAAHYAHQVWGAEHPEWLCVDSEQAKTSTTADAGWKYEVVFGSQDAGGLIQFHDGLPSPGGIKDCFVDEIITPHHSSWYTSPESEIQPATDFDRPVPVSFLAVESEFFVGVSSLGADLDSSWIEASQQLLVESLTTPGWGIGGKTSSGYGRFSTVYQINLDSKNFEAFVANYTGVDVAKAKSQVDLADRRFTTGQMVTLLLKKRIGNLGVWRVQICSGSKESSKLVEVDISKIGRFKKNKLRTLKPDQRINVFVSSESTRQCLECSQSAIGKIDLTICRQKNGVVASCCNSNRRSSLPRFGEGNAAGVCHRRQVCFQLLRKRITVGLWPKH